MTGSGGNQTPPAFTPEQEARIRELFGEELVGARARGPVEVKWAWRWQWSRLLSEGWSSISYAHGFSLGGWAFRPPQRRATQ